MGKTKKSPRKITTARLLRVLRDHKSTKSEESFTFITGAGASFSSGIPTGVSLAKKWYQEIKQDYDDHEYQAWLKKVEKDENTKLTDDNIGQFYPYIYKQRFSDCPQNGYDALFNAMEGKEPSLGYIYLAQIMKMTRHNIVVTTNFDSLLESALYQFTNSHPLVLGHESLANYIRPHSQRPTIIKIHRDLLMDPINDEETQHLAEEWRKALTPVITNRPLIVLGYGGNDGSLMDYLQGLDDSRKAIYWCCRNDDAIPDKVKSLLRNDDYLVKIESFDTLMLQLGDALGIEQIIHPDEKEKYNSRLWQQTDEKDKRLRKALETFAKDDPQVMQNIPSVKQQLADWWEYQLRIDSEQNVAKQENLYIEGIEQTQSVELMGNYALFLQDIRKDYDEAEKHYLKALEIDPQSASNNGNYALFLLDIRKDYNEAEKHYLKALEIDPEDAINNGNYASFLKNIRKNYDEAEKHYLKALEIDPQSASNNGNYALFLLDIRKDYDEAEKYYLKALEIDPQSANNNGNYANFLKNIRKDYDEAEKYYLKVLEIDPEYVINNGNYAGFLMGENRIAESLSFWDNAYQYANIDLEKPLFLELWFYKLAHIPEEQQKAQQEIDKLLAEGERSDNWIFDHNIRQAHQAKTADIELLMDYAERITGRKPEVDISKS